MLFEQTYQETKEVFRAWSQGEVIDVKRVIVWKEEQNGCDGQMG